MTNAYATSRGQGLLGQRLRSLWAERKFHFITAFVLIVGGGLLTVGLWPRSYYSSATLLLLSDGNRGMGFGDLVKSGIALSITGGPTSSPSQQKLVNILMSRALAEKVVDSTDLVSLTYGKGSDDLTDKRLGLAQTLQLKRIKVETRKPGLIEIFLRQDSPELAFTVLSSYIENLRRYLKDTTLTQGQRTKSFLESESARALAELNDFRERVRTYQSNNKMINAQSLLQNYHSSYQALLGNLVEVETNEAYLQKFLAPDNPFLVSEKERSRSLRNKILDLEKQAFRGAGGAGGDKKGSSENRTIMEYVALERELLIKQMIYEGLLRELQMARIEANREDLSFEVLDSPILIKKPVAPNLTVAAGAIIALLLLTFAAIGWQFFSQRLMSLRVVDSGARGPHLSPARPS